MSRLADGYDVLLVDLDGTVYRGQRGIDGAAPALAGLNVLYVTNNASRTPEQVALHLRELGFEAEAGTVVNSAQAGAALLAALVPARTPVYVVGADALRGEITAAGLTLAGRSEDARAVICGHNPDTGWRELSEAALAVRAGAVWVATNADATLPTDRGQLVGNGSMVAAVAHATGRSPRVAGKPQRPIFEMALRRANATTALVVGDRLDTDIEGANLLGADSLLVLTGVDDVAAVVRAPDALQPSFIAADLTALHASAAAARPGPRQGWSAEIEGERLLVTGSGRAVPEEFAQAAVHAARQVPAARRAELTLLLS